MLRKPRWSLFEFLTFAGESFHGSSCSSDAASRSCLPAMVNLCQAVCADASTAASIFAVAAEEGQFKAAYLREPPASLRPVLREGLAASRPSPRRSLRWERSGRLAMSFQELSVTSASTIMMATSSVPSALVTIRPATAMSNTAFSNWSTWGSRPTGRQSCARHRWGRERRTGQGGRCGF